MLVLDVGAQCGRFMARQQEAAEEGPALG